LKLSSLLSEDMILTCLKSRNKDDVLREMVEHMSGRVRLKPLGDLLCRLLERERLGPTSIGDGVAIPHAKLPGLRKPLLSLGLSKQGVAFDGPDAGLSHAIFLAASPLNKPEVNLRVLAAIAKVTRAGDGLAERLLAAPTAIDVLRILRHLEADGHG
jgi:mannitol/fructose-specific phosphotransferase system IIA component (Ntr-type)